MSESSGSPSVRQRVGAFKIGATNVLLFPGVVTRVGFRHLLGRVFGIRVNHHGFASSVGGRGRFEPTRTTVVIVVAGAAFLTAVVGGLFMSAAVVRGIYEGASLPGFLSLDIEALPRDLAWFFISPEDLLRFWVGLSCWWMVVTPQSDVIAAISAVRRGSGSSANPPSVFRRSGVALLTPWKWWAWVTDRVETTGGFVTVTFLYILASLVVRFAVNVQWG